MGLVSAGLGVGIHIWALVKANSVKKSISEQIDKTPGTEQLSLEQKEEFTKKATKDRKSAITNLAVSGVFLGAFAAVGAVWFSALALVSSVAAVCGLAIAGTVSGLFAGISAGAIGLYKSIKGAISNLTSRTNKKEPGNDLEQGLKVTSEVSQPGSESPNAREEREQAEIRSGEYRPARADDDRSDLESNVSDKADLESVGSALELEHEEAEENTFTITNVDGKPQATINNPERLNKQQQYETVLQAFLVCYFNQDHTKGKPTIYPLNCSDRKMQSMYYALAQMFEEKGYPIKFNDDAGVIYKDDSATRLSRTYYEQSFRPSGEERFEAYKELRQYFELQSARFNTPEATKAFRIASADKITFQLMQGQELREQVTKYVAPQYLGNIDNLLNGPSVGKQLKQTTQTGYGPEEQTNQHESVKKLVIARYQHTTEPPRNQSQTQPLNIEQRSKEIGLPKDLSYGAKAVLIKAHDKQTTVSYEEALSILNIKPNDEACVQKAEKAIRQIRAEVHSDSRRSVKPMLELASAANGLLDECKTAINKGPDKDSRPGSNR